jgi:hypothetical protein
LKKPLYYGHNLGFDCGWHDVTAKRGFPENLGKEFDAPFGRLDWISRNRFDLHIATPENGSACIAALPSPKRLTR